MTSFRENMLKEDPYTLGALGILGDGLAAMTAANVAGDWWERRQQRKERDAYALAKVRAFKDRYRRMKLHAAKPKKPRKPRTKKAA